MSYFSSTSPGGICEIRWHGRGGQGAITSAKYLAEAAYRAGFRGVTSQPSFGAERRGAPVTASTRLSPEPLRTFCRVERPDVVIVLDETLLDCADATDGLEDGGWLVVNSPCEPGAIAADGRFSVATADATAVAAECGLVVAGAIMVNTAMLGAVARATGLVELTHIEETLRDKFPEAIATRNIEAARAAFERTRL
ncbi:MAG: 2-oxoacid:acceptor oxidoreductase family protein [Candidatus Hydrogenedentes bacterium]|nr:2-oxoacid:acceptor oxidoreductase family protein [Candidatus Hydrogenedentota bacterium]